MADLHTTCPQIVFELEILILTSVCKYMLYFNFIDPCNFALSKLIC